MASFAGVIADVASVEAAIHGVAALTAASGVLVLVRITETHTRASSSERAQLVPD
jgi:hypothetical protein